ncbi:hypothetical protein MTO96_036622, partial [Rhipicephalus appendiculatus]
MDPERYLIRKEQLPDDETEKGQAYCGINLYLVSLIAVGLGVIGCVLISGLMLSFHSQDVPTTMTRYLVEWMRALNLDLMNETKLAAVNPVEMMVRCSLDIRVHVVISILLAEKEFHNKKRLIELRYSGEQVTWRGQNRGVGDYIMFLRMYGARAPMDEEIASKIKAYENQLDSTERASFHFGEFRDFIPISELGQRTTPYVTA